MGKFFNEVVSVGDIMVADDGSKREWQITKIVDYEVYAIRLDRPEPVEEELFDSRGSLSRN